MHNPILAAAIVVGASVTIGGCKKHERCAPGDSASGLQGSAEVLPDQAPRSRYAEKVRRKRMPSNRPKSALSNFAREYVAAKPSATLTVKEPRHEKFPLDHRNSRALDRGQAWPRRSSGASSSIPPNPRMLSSRSHKGQQIFTNTVTLANNAIAAYNLAYQMSLAPQSLYEPYLSPSTYWMLLDQAANTYGNSQPVMDTANSGTNAQYSYQFASVPRTEFS